MPNRTAQIHIAGNVEICYSNGQWEPILINQWDDQDAEVACNQLGFANDGTCDLPLWYYVCIANKDTNSTVDYIWHTKGSTGLLHRMI